MIVFSRPDMHHPRLFKAQLAPLIASIVGLCLWFVCTIAPAYAAPQRPANVHKIAFETAQDDLARHVDWRSPTATLIFDIPDNDWVDDVELLLTARPIGTVNPNSPLLVRFNDATPIPVMTDGEGFDARIRLDRLRIRKDRNQISFEYQVPAGEACLAPRHGAWDIDAAASFVVVKSRAKSRPVNFHDVKSHLASKTTAPKTVTLLSAGPDAVKLKALSAQGIARNVETIPNFTQSRAHAAFEIVAARRDLLPKWVSEKAITGGAGPQIAIGRSRPMQLVLTGDTDAQVLAAAQAFSSFAIPDSHNRDVSPTRFISTGLTINETRTIEGKVYLSRLNAQQFSSDWAPKPQHIRFDVADPAASYGSLALQLRAGPFVDPSSTMTATLNGHNLGIINIAKAKMNAKIDIPRGILRGLQNNLVLHPVLNPTSAQPVCASANIGPGFSLGTKSALTIQSDYTSDAADLSRFSASGLPFGANEGAGSHVILAARNTAEQYAAYKLLAQLGRASKSGWGNASITAMDAAVLPETGHVLLLGSRFGYDSELLLGAPKGLKVAMGGSVRQTPITTQSAALEPETETDAAALLSARQSVSGGVAALYRDEAHPERIIGVITQTKGQSFTRAVDNLLSGDHWSRLEGSVSRWNKDRVSMAQTALAPTVKSASTFKSLKIPSLPEMSLPEMSMPALSMPDISMPSFSMPDMSGLQQWAGETWAALTAKAHGLFTSRQPPSPLLLPQQDARQEAEPVPLPSFVPTPTLKRTVEKPSPAVFIPAPAAAKLKPVKLKPVKSAQTKLRAAPLNAYPQTDTPSLLPKGLSEAGSGVSSLYERSTQSISAKLGRSRMGQYRPGDHMGLQVLPFALLGMLLLLIAVFVKPAKP
ncbi:MAG: cellulose biosynthesis cyclic di-GMP-binding regulatory protein BcsB [Alphaproteobacteria bacterium]